MITRTVAWGDALLVVAVKAPGGLNRTVDHIRSVVGPQIGTRNSFAKLYRVDDPNTLAPIDRWRAWLLLTAVGESPEAWGIEGEYIPSLYMVKHDELRELLSSPLSDSNRRPPLYRTVTLDDLARARNHRTRPANRRDPHGPSGRAA